MEQALLLRLALDDARASLSDSEALWVAESLRPDGPRSEAPTLVIVPIVRVDAGGHTVEPLPMDLTEATRVWGVCLDTLEFDEGVLEGARLERIYCPTAMLTFDAEPLPRWRVRMVAPGISARDLQDRAPFGLVAGPDLCPLALAE
ncbi:MAG: hypothetical protein H6724_07690 [Sandaracinus sp.]|nr:hypothetical protein [Sandaracinus sp.]